MSRELGKHDTTAEDLSAQLPVYMPKDPGSGNYRLLKPIAESINNASADIEATDRALTVQHASTIEQLERIARLIDLPPRRNEGLEHYRARILARFQLVTSEGTVSDLLNGVSTILGASVRNISYTELHTSESGVCQVGVPGKKLDNLQLSESDFATIAEDLIAGGFRIDVLRKGTFTYQPESDYTGPYDSGSGGYDSTALDSYAPYGHDGLDTNGDPKDNGGTYAGLVQ